MSEDQVWGPLINRIHKHYTKQHKKSNNEGKFYTMYVLMPPCSRLTYLTQRYCQHTYMYVCSLLYACVLQGLSLVFGPMCVLLFSLLCQHLSTANYHVFHRPNLLSVYVCVSFIQLHKLIIVISPAVVL